MSAARNPVIRFLAAYLDTAEREAVLGDLAEAHETTSRMAFSLLGLVLRRQSAEFATWRGLAALACIAGVSYFLIDPALSLNTTIQHSITPPWNGKAQAVFPVSWRIYSITEKSITLAMWVWVTCYALARISPSSIRTSIPLFYLLLVHLPVQRFAGYQYPNWLYLPLLALFLLFAKSGASHGIQRPLNLNSH